MRIGILGTGIVGQTLGLKLVQLDHSVMLGTRDPSKLDEPKGYDLNVGTLNTWLATAGHDAGVGTFRDTADYGELLINALNGAICIDVLNDIEDKYLYGKTLLDVSNPVDISHGLPFSLFVKDTDSLGEMIQRTFPEVHVVKSLNTMGAKLMVNPKQVGNGDHTVFLSGNYLQAKAQVTKLLREFGWTDILDLGDISTARGAEMLISLGYAVIGAVNSPNIAFKIIR